MFIGLLRSRMFLSLGMFLLGVNALWNVPPRLWLKDKWWLAGLCWVAMYAISGLWSEDKAEWSAFLQMKLPFLLMPLTFYFLPPFSERQLQTIILLCGALLLGGAVYSVSFLVLDYQHYIQEYNVSHMIPTPVYGDYICFSTSCALFIVWACYTLPQFTSKTAKWAAIAIVILLAIYLHVLAAKSGIIALYLFAFAAAIYTTVVRRSLGALAALVAIPVFLFLGVTYVPTLHERKEHIVYTWYRYMDNDKSGKLGDLARLISYDISIKLIKEHPIIGVGAGDILHEMNKGYDKWHPEVTEEGNRLVPHNQFLTVALGCGIPAMLIFACWVIMPLFTLPPGRDRFFFNVTWLILLMQLMIEPFLEAQFGVFIYLFFPLMIMHSAKKQATG